VGTTGVAYEGQKTERLMRKYAVEKLNAELQPKAFKTEMQLTINEWPTDSVTIINNFIESSQMIVCIKTFETLITLEQ
jgi:hypothetical protein